jgi:hypothetical protein
MISSSEDNAQLVNVFIRTANKKARGILLPRELPADELKKVVSEKLHIPFESLTLFNQGE